MGVNIDNLIFKLQLFGENNNIKILGSAVISGGHRRRISADFHCFFNTKVYTIENSKIIDRKYDYLLYKTLDDRAIGCVGDKLFVLDDELKKIKETELVYIGDGETDNVIIRHSNAEYVARHKIIDVTDRYILLRNVHASTSLIVYDYIKEEIVCNRGTQHSIDSLGGRVVFTQRVVNFMNKNNATNIIITIFDDNEKVDIEVEDYGQSTAIIPYILPNGEVKPIICMIDRGNTLIYDEKKKEFVIDNSVNDINTEIIGRAKDKRDAFLLSHWKED